MSTEVATQPRLLVVSIHDVAPPFEEAVRSQIEALRGIGVDRLVLKVVPDWHGEYPLDNQGGLVKLLRDMVDSGSEIVLHGWQHRAVGSLRGSWEQCTRGKLFAGGAAEFLALNREQATQAVSLGQEMLARCGLAPAETFCPPGWLINEEALQGVRDAGIGHVIRMMSIEDLSSPQSTPAPSFGHMGVGGMQELGVRMMGARVRRSLGDKKVARVYLHPQTNHQDQFQERTFRDIAKLLSEDRQPATYRDLLHETPVA